MFGVRQVVYRSAQKGVGRVSKRSASDGLSFWESNNFENYMKNQAKRQAHAAKTTPFWKKMSLFVALPATLLAGYNAYRKEQVEHHKPRPEFVPYEHLRIRNKPFPWGDGNHSLFHHPVKNALPDGYEVPDPATEGGHHH